MRLWWILFLSSLLLKTLSVKWASRFQVWTCTRSTLIYAKMYTAASGGFTRNGTNVKKKNAPAMHFTLSKCTEHPLVYLWKKNAKNRIWWFSKILSWAHIANEPGFESSLILHRQHSWLDGLGTHSRENGNFTLGQAADKAHVL